MSVITNLDELDAAMAAVAKQTRVVVDTETTGLKPWQGDVLCGIGISWGNEGIEETGDTRLYIPYRHRNGDKDSDHELVKENLPLSSLDVVWDALHEVEELAGWNVKFDLAMMFQDGFLPHQDQGILECIMAARMCNGEHRADLSLSGQAKRVLGEEAAMYDAEFKAYLKKNKWSKNFDYAPIDVIAPYCERDCVYAGMMLTEYERYIAETEQTRVWKTERAVTRVLWEMEHAGIGTDLEYVRGQLGPMKERLDEVTASIYEYAGYEFNINSSQQLNKVMGNLGVKSTMKTDKNQPSWAAKALAVVKHPIANAILEQRGLGKLVKDYFEKALDWRDGTQHASFKNWGAVTGRMSCADPNLHSVAKNPQDLSGDVDVALLAGAKAIVGGKAVGVKYSDETEGLVSVRRMYVPRPGYKLYMMDYSQMEMRIFADYVKDDALSALCEDPLFDFHDHVAEQVWGVSKGEEMWDFYRFKAKGINFGLVFGMGINALSLALACTKEEAKEYKAAYFARFPKAYDFIDLVSKTVEQRGWIKNRFNRRYWIDYDRAYVGVNYLIQGTGADIVKEAMAEIREFTVSNGFKSRQLVQVHDEIIMEIPDEERAIVVPAVIAIMEKRRIETYLPVEASVGNPSWAQKTVVELAA